MQFKVIKVWDNSISDPTQLSNVKECVYSLLVVQKSNLKPHEHNHNTKSEQRIN